MKAAVILGISVIATTSSGFAQSAMVNPDVQINLLTESKPTGQGTTPLVPLKHSFPVKSIAMPVAFISYGFVSLGHNSFSRLNKNISAEVEEDMHGFKTNVDDYLKYAPAISTYALNIAGVTAKHKIVDRTIVFAVSSIVTNQVVTALKHATHQLRPDGSTYNSFPSGHTATAFVGAEFMNQELSGHSKWYGAAGYSMATATGLLRIANNRHWLGDVVAGAGIGMLTTKLTYWVYSKIEHKIHPQTVALY